MSHGSADAYASLRQGGTRTPGIGFPTLRLTDARPRAWPGRNLNLRNLNLKVPGPRNPHSRSPIPELAENQSFPIRPKPGVVREPAIPDSSSGRTGTRNPSRALRGPGAARRGYWGNRAILRPGGCGRVRTTLRFNLP
jgi:hypothetical protein